MGKRVLCIDDDVHILTFIEGALHSMGFMVVTTKDSSEGLALALRGKFDLIICDVMMPRMDGYDVCRALRRHRATRQTPLILATARQAPLTAQTAEILGAEYLPKPFRLNDLRILAHRSLGISAADNDVTQ